MPVGSTSSTNPSSIFFFFSPHVRNAHTQAPKYFSSSKTVLQTKPWIQIRIFKVCCQHDGSALQL